MQIDTRSNPFFITNPVNGNLSAASITTPVPQTAAPTGDGVIAMGHGGAMSANGLQLIPYGAGSPTNTFSLNAYGWRSTEGYGGTVPLWVAYLLASFTCTLCTVPGLAGCDVNASQLFVGTIALVVGNANISNEVVSPTGNIVAHIILDAKGARFVEVRFGTGSSATSCNCLATRI